MATVTIDMNADGSYKLHPPVIIITRGDQKITWKLKGKDWEWMTNPKGVICDTSSTNPPYSPWVGDTPALVGTDYVADAKSPNTGAAWVFYKWMFTVMNSATSQIVQVDPDIGNDPKP